MKFSGLLEDLTFKFAKRLLLFFFSGVFIFIGVKGVLLHAKIKKYK